MKAITLATQGFPNTLICIFPTKTSDIQPYSPPSDKACTWPLVNKKHLHIHTICRQSSSLSSTKQLCYGRGSVWAVRSWVEPYEVLYRLHHDINSCYDVNLPRPNIFFGTASFWCSGRVRQPNECSVHMYMQTCRGTGKDKNKKKTDRITDLRLCPIPILWSLHDVLLDQGWSYLPRFSYHRPGEPRFLLEVQYIHTFVHAPPDRAATGRFWQVMLVWRPDCAGSVPTQDYILNSMVLVYIHWYFQQSDARFLL